LAGRDEACFLEIIPVHLDSIFLRQLIHAFPVVFLQRKLIDQYVGFVKANSLGVEGLACLRTTDLMVRLDAC
jgi:hypothetical protein